MSTPSIPARGSILATRLRTARSSCSWPAYLERPANQREAHGLLMPSRNPIGWALRPPLSPPLRPLGRRFAAEAQALQSLLGRTAAHLVDHQAHFLRRGQDKARRGADVVF